MGHRVQRPCDVAVAVVATDVVDPAVVDEVRVPDAPVPPFGLFLLRRSAGEGVAVVGVSNGNGGCGSGGITPPPHHPQVPRRRSEGHHGVAVLADVVRALEVVDDPDRVTDAHVADKGEDERDGRQRRPDDAIGKVRPAAPAVAAAGAAVVGGRCHRELETVVTGVLIRPWFSEAPQSASPQRQRPLALAMAA